MVYGQGHHSAGGVQRLKPAVEAFLGEQGLEYVPGRPNPGCGRRLWMAPKLRDTAIVHIYCMACMANQGRHLAAEYPCLSDGVSASTHAKAAGGVAHPHFARAWRWLERTYVRMGFPGKVNRL